MLSNNFKLINTDNSNIKKNIFKLINKYEQLVSRENFLLICYITYIKDNNGKDRLVYSGRMGEGLYRTWYEHESTRICELSNNKIINDKQLITDNNMSHNLTLFNDNNNIIGYGGVCTESHSSKNKYGIKSFVFNDDKISNIKLTIPKNIGFKANYATAFDSNISCLKYKNKYYVYTRYNVKQGIRKTQLFISDNFDSGFKATGIVTFNDPTVFTYTQTVFIENGIFIGIFRIYRKKNLHSHHLYNSDTKISYITAHSFDGINFIINNENFIKNYNYTYDIISSYKNCKNKKSFFSVSCNSPPNNNNIINEYEIRDGGYVYYEPDISSNESNIDLQVMENKKYILLNYMISENGYINIYFIDENKNEISKRELLIKDSTNKTINLPENCKFINIVFYKSKIYQIL